MDIAIIIPAELEGESNYARRKQDYATMIAQAGHSVVDMITIGKDVDLYYLEEAAHTAKNTGLLLFTESLRSLPHADAVLLGTGWQHDARCRIVNQICNLYGVKTITETGALRQFLRGVEGKDDTR